MSDAKGHMTIIFLRSHPWPSLRLFRRHWQLAIGCGFGVVTCCLSQSQLAHCAVAGKSSVIECSVAGTRTHDIEAWMLVQDKLIDGAYEVPHGPMFGPQKWPRRLWQPLDFAGRFVNWLTKGKIHWWQCTSPAVWALHAAGVDVPRRVVTPRHLWEYLSDQGFEYRTHTPAPVAAARRSADPRLD